MGFVSKITCSTCWIRARQLDWFDCSVHYYFKFIMTSSMVFVSVISNIRWQQQWMSCSYFQCFGTQEAFASSSWSLGFLGYLSFTGCPFDTVGSDPGGVDFVIQRWYLDPEVTLFDQWLIYFQLLADQIQMESHFEFQSAGWPPSCRKYPWVTCWWSTFGNLGLGTSLADV